MNVHAATFTGVNALSVDVEDWYHDESRGFGPTEDEIAAGSRRVQRNLERLLEIFAQSGTKATLFFLADVATELAPLVRAAAREGHEIACHGLRHVPVDFRERAEFGADVRRAREMIEDVLGAPVLGFRAPCFVRHEAHLWALDEIAAAGFVYDSSWMPLEFWPGEPRLLGNGGGPVRLENGLWEFPLPLTRIATGHVLPLACGGFPLRAFPLGFTRHYLRRFNREVGPAVVYTHPWEIDPDSPKLPGTRAHVRFFNGVGRRGMADKLARLTREMRFAPLATVYARELASEPALSAHPAR
ncbi:MAG TPA: polysaccharide deacetylase family protein [Candidatus Binatia bacterium]